MIADIFLFGLGLVGGLVVAGYWLYRARVAAADLMDARARLERVRAERDAARSKAARLEQVLDGHDVRGYWPEPLRMMEEGR